MKKLLLTITMLAITLTAQASPTTLLLTSDASWDALQKQLQDFRHRHEADIPSPVSAATPTPKHDVHDVVKSAEVQSLWVYSRQEDEMGRGTLKFAHADSLTTLDFGFPYQGTQVMRLVLQKSPTQGKGAYIKVDHGQFHIRYPHSNFTIRFDNGRLHTFPFDSSDEGRSDTAVLGYGQYDRFIALLRKAKTMDIEADFYGEGTRVVTFDVHGLEGW